jgi:RNA polymerase sigma-70 factor (ECF subfamily)
MAPPHDADLTARWQRGDPSAFEEIVRRWQQPMARFLFRLTGEAERVRDLCQEVFLRVYQARAKYRENGGFAAWMYRIALNVARDAARRRRPPVHLPAGADPIDPGTPAETAALRRELARLVADAVASLPEPLRVVLALHHDEGLNFEEMARLTGTPASTLKSRFASALRRLRVALEERGLGPEEDTP